MRYWVKTRDTTGQAQNLLSAIKSGDPGRGSIAGDEYQHNMEQARVDQSGVVHWVETCFCTTPLEEERPYWEKYFELLSAKDAPTRRNCRHENGSEPQACCDCDCTARLEERLRSLGRPLLEALRNSKSERSSGQ